MLLECDRLGWLHNTDHPASRIHTAALQVLQCATGGGFRQLCPFSRDGVVAAEQLAVREPKVLRNAFTEPRC